MRISKRAFTLVELVVVILILGILTGVAAPRFIDVSQEGSEAVAAAIVRQVADKIAMATATSGDVPKSIDPSWFHSRVVPQSPYNSYGIATIQNVNSPGRDHPVSKVITESSAGAMWYNRANGAIRIRVPDQGKPAATLELYNRVNYGEVDSLADELSKS